MGSLVGNTCYATNSEALDAWFTAKDPSYTAGSTSYLSYFDKSSGTWMIVRKSINSAGTVNNLNSSTAPLPNFPSCDPSAPFLDGVQMGWGIALAMMLAWSITIMKKAL